jgi:tetratricopeptide (TPR) repeat protein
MLRIRRSRARRLALIGAAIICLEAPAMSDQNDPRLDGLFAQLADATSVAEGAMLERQIWDLWYDVDDDAVDARLREGAAAMERGDGTAALAAFDAVVGMKPDFAEGWNRRATLYFLMQRFPESVADIERTLELEPRHFGALSGLALIRKTQNEPFAALEALERVARIHPRMPHLMERVDELTSMLGEAI